MKLPVLFLGHGSPMNAIEDTPYSLAWEKLGQTLKQRYGHEIKTVLSISAHWYTADTRVTAMLQPRTIHDFGRFPQALFDVRYPAEGSPELAEKIRMLLGGDVAADTEWGLDHGTWSVLCRVFPEADIPVVQLSLNADLSFAEHYEIGRRLAALREEGVLIAASGSIIHNLRLMDRSGLAKAGEGYPWAHEFKNWVNSRLLAGDTAALTDENSYPASWIQAAPTPEHYWPLLYALGAADGDAARLFNDDLVEYTLSMTSVVWGME